LFAAALGPVFWHIWVMGGAGNANFFYATTLVHSLGLILVVADTLQAFRLTAHVRAHPEHAAVALALS
jgi:hypothetical protein